MARGSTGWTFFLCLWLSLATVFAHAVLPVGSPLARQSGSAFSISTSDVALTPKRRVTPADPARQIGVPAPDRPGATPGPDEGAALPSAALPPLAAALVEPARFASYPSPGPVFPRGLFKARAPPIG